MTIDDLKFYEMNKDVLRKVLEKGYVTRGMYDIHIQNGKQVKKTESGNNANLFPRVNDYSKAILAEMHEDLFKTTKLEVIKLIEAKVKQMRTSVGRALKNLEKENLVKKIGKFYVCVKQINKSHAHQYLLDVLRPAKQHVYVISSKLFVIPLEDKNDEPYTTVLIPYAANSNPSKHSSVDRVQIDEIIKCMYYYLLDNEEEKEYIRITYVENNILMFIDMDYKRRKEILTTLNTLIEEIKKIEKKKSMISLVKKPKPEEEITQET